MSDAARDIRSHIDAAHAAAEQLVREAEERAREQAGEVPPRGWDVPPPAGGESPAFPDLAALVALLDSVRGAVPPELTTQLADALREMLVALRALLDWYIDRLERFTPGGPGDAERPPRVEEIQID